MQEKYKILGTTADVKLRVFGEDREQLFQNAARGLLEILKPNCGQEPVERKFKVESDNEDRLLIDFLNDFLFEMHTNKECYDELEFDFKNDYTLKVKARGRKLNGFGEDVKAATYYDLKLFKNEKGILECEVVFDI